MTTDRFALSAQQRRLWSAAGGHGCVQSAIAVDGFADLADLRRALERAVARHEVLRTTFERVEGLRFPLQVVHAELPLAWSEDPTAMGALDGVDLAALCEAERARPFDLERASPVRARALSSGPDRHILVLTISALCADQATMAILFRELAGPDDGVLGEIDHGQLVAWQEAQRQAEDADEGAAFWREQAAAAAAADAPLALERGRSGGTDASGTATAAGSSSVAPLEGGFLRGALDERELGPTVRERLDALAIGAGLSVRSLLLASFHRVLRRFTAAESIATWVALDLRDDELLAQVCGAVECAVPLAGSGAGSGSGAALGTLGDEAATIERALEAATEWLPHYRPDLDPAMVCAGPAGGPTVGFRFAELPDPAEPTERHSARAASRFAAARFSLLHTWAPGPAPAGLNVTCLLRSGGLSLRCVYDPGRFAPALAAALLDGFAASLAAADLASGPGDVPLRVDPGVAAGARVAAAPPGLLHRLFEERAALDPDRIAVRCDREELTFAALDRRADAIAQALLAAGLGAEDPVALYLERSSWMIAAILGVLKAGGAYLPLHAGDPAGRTRAILDGAGARLVVADALAAGREAMFAGREVIWLDPGLAASPASPASPTSPVPPASPGRASVRSSPDQLAYVLYTSGSTGAPKGVEIEHRSVVNLLAALRGVYAPLGGACRVGLNAPFAFDASVKQWIQILDGHTLCIAPESARLDPAALWAFAVESRLDVLDCTPSALRPLLRARAAAPGRGPRAILVGGEPIDPALWSTLAGDPDTVFYNVYGPTECTVDATIARVGEGGPAAPEATIEATIGRAIDGATARVLDDRLRPLPVGAPGELCVGGAGVGRGYRGRPGATAERFAPDPHSAIPGARLYRTGDLACLREDGQLVYLGRRDGQVKIRGHRIELGEIEAALIRSADVRDAVAAVRRRAGRDDHSIVAYVVPRAGAAIQRERLRDELRQVLPEPMVPAAFVVLAALPLTANGKLDRAALPDPDDRAFGAAGGRAAAGTGTERLVAAIWQEVLGATSLGAHDNFFDVGGHSLLMVQVHSRLREALGRDIPMVELFRQPTIAALAEYLDRPAGGAAAAASAGRASRRLDALDAAMNRRGRRRT